MNRRRFICDVGDCPATLEVVAHNGESPRPVPGWTVHDCAEVGGIWLCPVHELCPVCGQPGEEPP